MSKKLVAYFSASGVTAEVAKTIADTLGADLFEIRPEVPYTLEDLNWLNRKSRSSLEMADLSYRPPVAEKLENMEEYDRIFLGFPIWWHIAPTIVNTFLESYDLSGKQIVLFATSGGSGFGKTVEKLKDSCPGAALKEGRLMIGRGSRTELVAWAKSVNRDL